MSRKGSGLSPNPETPKSADICIFIRQATRSCGNTAKRLVEIEGAGHNDLMFRGAERYWSAVREHITQTNPKR
jgi:hypothetical protein